MIELLPAELSMPAAVALVALSLLTSALTAALGAGGGLLMLAAMAGLLPPLALIPVHGLVQLGSNAGRAMLSRRHVEWRVAAVLLAGAVPGAVLGALVLVQIQAALLQVAVGAFILLVAWVPMPRAGSGSVPGIAVFGAFSGFLSLFVGATGPLVGAFVQRLARGRLEAVATMAACMSGLNLCKLAAFGVAGFSWLGWLPLCIAMIASGVAGTRFGLGLLDRIPEQRFRQAFRLVLSALAAHALWRGLAEFL